MKIIKKVILILVVFFIASIFTTIVQEMNIPFLPIVPPLIGFYVIYKIIKK
jgi:phage-related holin